ncbi:MAG: acyl dehydratase [Ramlibacter sp.]
MTATPFFEDVAAGMEVASLMKGPLTTVHLMRWSAAMENWHRIHYDHAFATGHDGLPGLLVNGSFKQQFVMQLLKDWAGPQGWVWKAAFQFRAMNQAGETLRIWARVKDKRRANGFGLIDLELGIVNEHGIESTPGTAVVVLPYRGGPPVPYPFVPPA